MIRSMTLKEWERDIVNRQRNIVFPDTVLNEGRFYRNIASGKAVFSVGQRISLLGIVGYFIFINALDFAGRFGQLLANNPRRPAGQFLATSLLSLMWLLFWIFLAMKALFPNSEPRKRRRGYRHSSLE